jgi:hypothetical protein
MAHIPVTWRPASLPQWLRPRLLGGGRSEARAEGWVLWPAHACVKPGPSSLRLGFCMLSFHGRLIFNFIE